MSRVFSDSKVVQGVKFPVSTE